MSCGQLEFTATSGVWIVELNCIPLHYRISCLLNFPLNKKCCEQSEFTVTSGIWIVELKCIALHNRISCLLKFPLYKMCFRQSEFTATSGVWIVELNCILLHYRITCIKLSIIQDMLWAIRVYCYFRCMNRWAKFHSIAQ